MAKFCIVKNVVGCGISFSYWKNIQDLIINTWASFIQTKIKEMDHSNIFYLEMEQVLFLLLMKKTGDIHATRRIDREEKAFYTMSAQAINRRNLRPVEPESEFVIKIHDINDNEPTFPEEIYTASVPEMSVVGTSVVQVTATDADDPSYGNSARVIYSILQGQPYFSVEPETGIIRTALPNMNRENREQYQVVIQAKDMAARWEAYRGLPR